MVNLGDKVRDVVTDFEGIVIGRVEYLTGCNQCLVTPKIDKDGKRQTGEWFDEQRLQVLEAGAVKLDNGKTPGFDQAPPLR